MNVDWPQIATAIAVIAVAIIGKLDAIKSRKEAEADRKMAEKLEKNLAVVHGLVNSGMLQQKKWTWLALERVAQLTKAPDDIAAALEAEKLYHEHEKQQAKVDQQNATKP